MYIIIGVLLVVAALYFLNKTDKHQDVQGTQKEEEEVPQGLHVLDQNGNIDIDLTSRLVKLVGSFLLTDIKGQFIMEGLAGHDVWFTYERKPQSGRSKSFEPYETDMFYPIFTVVGNTIKWEIVWPPYISPGLGNMRMTDAVLSEFVRDQNITVFVGVY